MADKNQLQKQLRYVIRLLNNPLIISNDHMRNYAIEVFSNAVNRLNNFCNGLDKSEESNDTE